MCGRKPPPNVTASVAVFYGIFFQASEETRKAFPAQLSGLPRPTQWPVRRREWGSTCDRERDAAGARIADLTEGRGGKAERMQGTKEGAGAAPRARREGGPFFKIKGGHCVRFLLRFFGGCARPPPCGRGVFRASPPAAGPPALRAGGVRTDNAPPCGVWGQDATDSPVNTAG